MVWEKVFVSRKPVPKETEEEKGCKFLSPDFSLLFKVSRLSCRNRSVSSKALSATPCIRWLLTIAGRTFMAAKVFELGIKTQAVIEKIPSRRANKKTATELESAAIKTKKRANKNITIKPISILSIAPIQKMSEAVISTMMNL